MATATGYCRSQIHAGWVSLGSPRTGWAFGMSPRPISARVEMHKDGLVTFWRDERRGSQVGIWLVLHESWNSCMYASYLFFSLFFCRVGLSASPVRRLFGVGWALAVEIWDFYFLFNFGVMVHVINWIYAVSGWVYHFIFIFFRYSGFHLGFCLFRVCFPFWLFGRPLYCIGRLWSSIISNYFKATFKTGIPGSVHYWLHIIIAKMMSASQLSLPHTMCSVQPETIEVIGYCVPFAN